VTETWRLAPAVVDVPPRADVRTREEVVRAREADASGETSPLTDLYERYHHDLHRAIGEIEAIHAGHRGRGQAMRVQFDDLEAEALYLTIRDHRPDCVVEISPCDGWSTLWMLKALEHNGTGRLISYDLHDRSATFVQATTRWELRIGDVRARPDLLPEQIDHLLIDSAHTSSFARWYMEAVIPRLADRAPVVIHDVEHPTARLPWSEARVIRSALRSRADVLTLSRWSAAGRAEARRVRALRAALGLPQHSVATRTNPAVFLLAGRKLLLGSDR
jgi:predicted O-methyltransferase YrrM